MDRRWIWAAHGKHPSAKDFFSVGRKFPLFSDFSEWIKKGYPLPSGREQQVTGGCSWRFWARGTGKNELACGLLRDSYDSFGRPYPLLVIGAGELPSWEEHWEMLPLVCERVWSQIEFISTRGFSALGTFEGEIGKIRPPDPEWRASGQTFDDASPRLVQELERCAREARNAGDSEMGRINLGMDDSNDGHFLIMRLNAVLKNVFARAPNTLFIGGTSNESALFFFRRPMRPVDFAALWEPGSGAE